MTKNTPQSFVQKRAEEMGISLRLSSLESEKKDVVNHVLEQAEIFWREYYTQKVENIIEKKSEAAYILSPQQQKWVDFLKEHAHKNCAIIAPTGFGKTVIVFEEMLRFLKNKNRIFFTAPTNDLVDQQYEDFCDFCKLKWQEILVQRMQKGSENIESAKVVFSTPHLLQSIAKMKKIENNDLLVCDEIHTGEGKEWKHLWEIKYPTFEMLDILKEKNISPRVIGLTATTNKNMLRKFFADGNVCRLGSKADFYKKKFHFSKEWGNILEESKMNEFQNDMYQRKTKLARAFYENLYEMIDFRANAYLRDYWSDENMLKLNYIPEEKKKEIISFIESTNLDFRDKYSLKNMFYQLNKMNVYKKHLDENNYHIFLYKLVDDYQKLEDRTTYEADFINMLWKKMKKWVIDEKKVHPKEMKLDELLAKNNGKTILVYVENEELIEYFMKKYSKKYRCSFLKSAKNNTGKVINDYTREAMNARKLDVVFATSVTKLGMNLDVNDLFLYHLPKNYKDFLQFLGRIGRFERPGEFQENNIYCYYPDNTLEKVMNFRISKEAKAYMDEFFVDEAETSPASAVVHTPNIHTPQPGELFSQAELYSHPVPMRKKKR